MISNIKKALTALACILFFQFCGTVAGTLKDGLGVYRGTRVDVNLIKQLGFGCGREWGCLPLIISTGALIDTPFSVVGDTVMLPLTGPMSLAYGDFYGLHDIYDENNNAIYQEVSFSQDMKLFKGYTKEKKLVLSLKRIDGRTYKGSFIDKKFKILINAVFKRDQEGNWAFSFQREGKSFNYTIKSRD